MTTEARPDSDAGVSHVGPAEVAKLAAPAARAERRIRLGRALSVGTSALCAALVGTAVVLVLRKTGHTSERTARLLFGAAGVATLAASVVAYLRPLAARAGAVALDRYHSLADRLSSALSFASLPPATRTAFMEVAIQDAVRVLPTIDPRRAVPFTRPRDTWAALALVAVTIGIGLFEVRHHETVVAAKTIDAVDVTADDLDAMRDFLKEVEAKDQSDETKAATQDFNQLIQDLAAKRLDRTEAFRRMQALEDKLLEGSEADHKALEAALKKIGEELKKAELTRPAGMALSADNLADAEKAMKELAERLRKDGKGAASKEQLDKMREALKAAAADNAKQQESINERREELQKQLLKEKQKQGDGGASEEEKSLLKKKERELERLDKEQEAAQAAGRQLDRLDRELAQAAEDLMKDLGVTADDLDKSAEDINRMAQSEMTQEEKEQLKQKIDELRDMLRQQGQGGKQQMVRLRRFQAGAHGQGQGGQGQGQPGEGQEGQGGQEGQEGQQGQNGQGQSGQGQGGQGQQGQGQGQQGQGGQNGQGQGGQAGQGQGGQGQGQGGHGGQGELWVVGPNGEKLLMISRGGAGQGQGGAGQGENGGGGKGQPGHGWGTGHDDHVQGAAHSIKSGTEDTQVAGQDTGQGGSRSEVIQGAAERGFASKGYTKVFREYHTVAEEALQKDEIPGGYRSYVRRYFELIRPREQK